jgi:16S rRNA (adenine1518-N6/adenine1519-N6)-dimethyltransferase
MKLSKSFGQVFLRDKNYTKRICESLKIEGQDILEIGPGDGQMSAFLADKGKFLYCVEIDTRLCNFLKEKFKDVSNIEINRGDILKYPFSKLGKKVVVFGNVPYHISNQLIRYLVENRKYIKKGYFTFQKEFVDKLVAVPSTKLYGFISCYIRFYAAVKKLFDIPAQAFFPSPKVDSAFVEIDFYSKNPYGIADENYLFDIIRRVFSNRRKKIVNSLPFPKDKVKQILSSLKISPDARAENLSLEDYTAFVKIIKENKI